MYENTGQKKLTAGCMVQLLLNYWQENLFLRMEEVCLWNLECFHLGCACWCSRYLCIDKYVLSRLVAAVI